MTRKPIRLLAAMAAIVVAGLAVAALARDHRPSLAAATVNTEHGRITLAKGEQKRILDATAAATSQTANDALVAKGRAIFRDTSLFEDGETCQTCHAEGSASAKLGTMVHDSRVPNLAVKPSPSPPTDFDGPRDPPALWDLAKTAPYFWDGDVPTLSAAVMRPVLGHMKTFVVGGKPNGPDEPDCTPDANGNRSAACDQLAGDRVAALTAYIKSLQPPATSFDEGTLSPQALAGEKIFQGKGGCIECHGGPQFTDNLTHNTGVPQVSFTSPYGTGGPRMSSDLGAKPPPPDPACAGATPAAGCDAAPPATSAFINTPQLRDLASTAPYMHNGAFKTLTDVVQFYNRDSTLAPLNLTSTEVADLVAYLQSL
jgi:cytochrome c peroxidase